MGEEKVTFTFWQNMLYPLMIFGIIFGLICFLVWKINWFTIRLWIVISIIFGLVCVIKDELTRMESRKENENKINRKRRKK